MACYFREGILKFEIEKVASISAIIVAVIALVVAIYETRMTRTYHEKSVWPHLTYYYSSVSKIKDNRIAPFAVFIKNDGVGPALVKSIQFFYMGREYESFSKVFKDIVPDDKSEKLYTDKEVLKVIRSSDDAHIFSSFSDNESLKKIWAAQNNLELKVCYCSLYNECWNLNKSGVSRIKKCSH